VQIRDCESRDVAQVCDIYNHYITHTAITFEEEPLEVSQMQARVDTYTKLYPWLVCCTGDSVVGYAYASKWKERAAYSHTAEVTVYLHESHQGKGYGKALYADLLASLDSMGCHVALGCIALPNEASVRLHEDFGFIKVGHFCEVGRKFGQWLDVGYWQRREGTPLPC
jgi:L-amino acid N-acyltransferase YncA